MYVTNNNYNPSEVIMLKEKGRIIAIPSMSSFKSGTNMIK